MVDLSSFFLVFNNFAVYITLSVYAVHPFALHCSDFGANGIIRTPNAYMDADGDIKAVYSRSNVADIYGLNFQATPWLQTTFRYSIFNPRNFAASKDRERDRSYGIKGNYLP